MGYRSSGNATVDALGDLSFTGNIIADEWYKLIRKPKTGEAYLLAINILSDIVYWMRPTEVRDERTGEVIGWKKKFYGEMLQKSYQAYADKYGKSRKTIKLAFDHLVNLGVVKRYFYDIKYETGNVIPNQMFLDLDLEVLKKITYPKDENGTTAKTLKRVLVPSYCNNPDENVDETGISDDMDAKENIYGQGDGDILTNLSGYPDNDVSTSPVDISAYDDDGAGGSCNLDGGYYSGDVGTNTKNTTENNHKDHIISIKPGSAMEKQGKEVIDEIRSNAEFMDAIIKRHINYEWHMENDDANRADDFHELYLLMHDVMCGEHSGPVMINRTPMDPDAVRKRYLRLNDQHLAYVIDSLKKNPNREGIGDIRSYMLTCLYNAPVTMGQYYQQLFNHDETNCVYQKMMENKKRDSVENAEDDS